MQPPQLYSDYVRITQLLYGPDHKRTLIEAVATALSGTRPSQCDDYEEAPALFVEGSVQWCGDMVRVRLALCAMHDQTVLTTVRHDYPGSLSHETIAQDIAGRFWAKIEAQGLQLGEHDEEDRTHTA